MRLFLGMLVLVLVIFSSSLGQAQEEEGEGGEREIYYEDITNDPHEPSIVWRVAWSPNGGMIAYSVGADHCGLSNNDYSIHLLDIHSSIEILNVANANQCPITDLEWSPDSRMILGGTEGSVGIWEINTGQLVSGMNTSDMMNPFSDHAWSPDGNFIASTTYFVEIWNPLGTSEVNSLDRERQHSTSVTWSPDSRHIAIGSTTIEIWDIVTETQVQPHFTSAASNITWSPDGTRIAGIVANYRQIRIFDATTGAILNTIGEETDSINQVEWSPDSRYIASASSDGTVRVWDAETGEELAVYEYGGRVYSVDWSPDGEYLAFGGASRDGQDAELQIVRVWEAETP